jgi:hypothetical protein
MVQRKNQNQDLRDLEDSCYVLTNLYIRINHMGNTNCYINSKTYERNRIVPNLRIDIYRLVNDKVYILVHANLYGISYKIYKFL